MTQGQIIFSTISALVALTGLFLSIFAFRHARKREQSEELKEKFTQLDDVLRRLAVIELQVNVFWKSVSFSSAQSLHSPHTPQLDALIEKFQREQINDSELREFKRLLKQIAEDPNETAFRKKSAREVLALIHVRYEIAAGR